MQNFPVAARAFALVIILFVAPSFSQSTVRHQSSNARETAINIEKANSRPVAPVEVAI